MTIELEVLREVSRRLEAADLGYMLTGSFADEFYIDRDDVHAAIRSGRMFNLMHLGSGVKVDMIVRKPSTYRRLEFDRRRQVEIAGVATWIVTREDLVLSKLEWSKATRSELQDRDVRQLLAGEVDLHYLRTWAANLGVSEALEKALA